MKSPTHLPLLFSLGIHALILALMGLAVQHSTETQFDHLTQSQPQDLKLSWGHAPQARLAPSHSALEAQLSPDLAHSSVSAPSGVTQSNALAPAPGSAVLLAGDPYYGKVRAQILAQVTYPIELVRRRISGQVFLKLWINPNGSLQKLELEKSSGHKELDELAQKAVQLAAPFEAYSPSKATETDATPGAPRQILIPIDYQHTL